MAITDLKGMTVTIPAGWTATAGYGKFDVDFEMDGGPSVYYGLAIGYSGNSTDGTDFITTAKSNTVCVHCNMPPLTNITNDYEIELAFKDGTDTTNANLIAWVEANMEKATPTATFDLTTLDLSEGTHTITVIGKADGYKASAASAGVSYTVEPSTVTLAAGTYVGNDSITVTLNGAYNINYSSYGGNYTAMYFKSSNPSIAYGDHEYAPIAWFDGWSNTEYKTIKLDTDQEVSEAFGTWFNANFTKQADGYTVVVTGYAEDASANIQINGEDVDTTTDFGDFSYTYENVKTFRIYTSSGNGITVNEGTGSLANYTISNDTTKPNNGATVNITEDSTLDVNVLD